MRLRGRPASWTRIRAIRKWSPASGKPPMKRDKSPTIKLQADILQRNRHVRLHLETKDIRKHGLHIYGQIPRYRWVAVEITTLSSLALFRSSTQTAMFKSTPGMIRVCQRF